MAGCTPKCKRWRLISEQEEATVQETRDEIAAGAPLISLDEIKRESGTVPRDR